MQQFILLTMMFGLQSSPISLDKIHSSDPTLFTQGFEQINDRQLLIASGLYGQSQIGILNKQTGDFESLDTLDKSIFGEGVTQTPYGIWQLTWKNGQAFLRDSETFEVVQTVTYDTEGWGIAYDATEDCLWMSDGSDTLYQRDAQTFELLSQYHIKDGNGQSVKFLNELEYVDGRIYANIWYTQSVVAISKDTMRVEKVYDFTQILEDVKVSQAEREKMDVLNGIAHKEGRQFYITGKYYPVILEVTLN